MTGRVDYGPVIADILREERLQPLGPGQPNDAVRPLLDGLSVATAFAHAEVRDVAMAACCLGGLWLYHDFLDESHKLSQDIDTPTGSYWHGILHRREPDFSNAKYWFRRVGVHPVFEPLCRVAQGLAAGDPDAEHLGRQSSWDPFAFIDFCEGCLTRRRAGERLCRQVQQHEWQLLFDYCYRQAVGR